MSDPTTDNKTADVVNQVLSALIDGASKDAVEASLLAAYPFLALPFAKQIFEFILNQIAQEIYVGAARIATKIVIDLQVNKEASVVMITFQNLQMAIASKDPNAIAMASADLSLAYKALINSDGWSIP